MKLKYYFKFNKYLLNIILYTLLGTIVNLFINFEILPIIPEKLLIFYKVFQYSLIISLYTFSLLQIRKVSKAIYLHFAEYYRLKRIILNEVKKGRKADIELFNELNVSLCGIEVLEALKEDFNIT